MTKIGLPLSFSFILLGLLITIGKSKKGFTPQFNPPQRLQHKMRPDLRISIQNNRLYMAMK